jgi:acyl-CoA synthetase (NDP forming)
MTDSDATDLRALWDKAAESGPLRPTAEEQESMRQAVLERIARSPRQDTVVPLAVPTPATSQAQRARSLRQRWAFAASLAAAAVLVVSVALRRDTERPAQVAGNTTSPTNDTTRTAVRAPSELPDLANVSSAPMRTALQLASREASPEFAVLDAAAEELDAALARTPDDAELRAFRAALDARRDELAQRVRSVTE